MPEMENAILTRTEFKFLRKQIIGWTFSHLSKSSGVSITQLCEYERGSRNLRDEQLQSCQKVLVQEMRNRGKQISVLLADEKVDDREKAMAG
jgi:hypothetical protein